MKSTILKTFLVVVVLYLIELRFSYSVVASELNLDKQMDEVILKVNKGESKGEIGLSDTLRGGGNGPSTFIVDSDETIYIYDTMNDRINVYRDRNFLYDIKLPYSGYIMSMVISRGLIYLMDYDFGKIHVLNKKGKLIRSISLPDDIESYRMCGLYTRYDGSVWLYCMSEIDSDESGTYYRIDSIRAAFKTTTKEFSKDGINFYDMEYITKKNVNIRKTDASGNAKDEGRIINFTTKEGSVDLDILNIDSKGKIFIDVFEVLNTSIVEGEDTVRRYYNGICTGISKIDLSKYKYIPHDLLKVTENGDLYQIVCLDDRVEILKKRFQKPSEFKTDIDNIKTKTETMIKERLLEEERILKEKTNEYVFELKAIISAPNDRSTTKKTAIAICDLPWFYNTENFQKPKGVRVKAPVYLKKSKKSSKHKGIPYCWGGFDGITTSSNPYSWSNFLDAMDKGKFAGNIDTSYGYQQGTAGLDCSGFVSSAAGFSSKLSTYDLASSVYTKSVAEDNVKPFDIYVSKGNHVLFFIKEKNSKEIVTREATTAGKAEKAKLFHRTRKDLGVYELRRFNGW